MSTSDTNTPKYIVIEGPIGVGKTTLARKLASSLNYELLLERADENPFLANFYRNPVSNALSTQLFFLLQRVKQIQQLSQDGIFPGTYVADFMIERDRVFAEVTLDEKELDLYQSIYAQLTVTAPVPDRVIYLQAPPPVLMRRIRERSIEYEQSIGAHYLERIHDAYGKFFMRYDDAPLLVVNANAIDLLNNEQEYEHFLQLLLSAKSGRYFYNVALL